jgi:hypothetical protein
VRSRQYLRESAALGWRSGGLLWVATLALLSGCMKLSMKPPDKGVEPQLVKVSDYSPSPSSRDHQLSIGAAKLGDVSGTPIVPPGLSAYGRIAEQDKWNYKFTLREGKHGLRAECTEQPGAVRFFAVGEIMLDLRCTCFEGDKRVATLALASGKGEAVLEGNAHYRLSESRQSKEGRKSRAVLGYRFDAVKGGGAGGIDVSRRPLAYLPIGLLPEQRLPLTCLYAALLLHRPVK